MKNRHRPKYCLLPRLPVKEDPRLWLYVFLGPRLFGDFQKAFGGRRLLVPKFPLAAPCSYCPARARCIAIFKREGLRPSAIGRRFGLSLKRVYALLQSNGASCLSA